MQPPIPLHDSRFQYTHSSKTDVQRTWRRFGWTPPTEAYPERFKAIRRELNSGLDADL